MADHIKLHLGCGEHIFPGWENFDLNPGIGGFYLDLRQPFPFSHESVDYIFTEHAIEHMTAADGFLFLKECHRVLSPGGVIRISTPNLRSLIDDYLHRKLDRYQPTWEPLSPARMMNEGMRLWGHEFIYDLEELYYALDLSGFHSIYEKPWRKSDHAALRGLEVRPFHNDLILEAMR